MALAYQSEFQLFRVRACCREIFRGEGPIYFLPRDIHRMWIFYRRQSRECRYLCEAALVAYLSSKGLVARVRTESGDAVNSTADFSHCLFFRDDGKIVWDLLFIGCDDPTDPSIHAKIFDSCPIFR